MNGHYCNQVADPGTCCPCGHGETDERFCTCKVSPEMAKAVETFMHQLYLESYRQYDKTLKIWVLRKHKPFKPGDMSYVNCRLHQGAGLPKDGKCCWCKEEFDWQV